MPIPDRPMTFPFPEPATASGKLPGRKPIQQPAVKWGFEIIHSE
jgi:hypothetical protein